MMCLWSDTVIMLPCMLPSVGLCSTVSSKQLLMHALSALWTALEMQSACMHLGTKGLLKSYPDVRTNNSSLLRETKNKSKWRAMRHCWRMKTPRTQQPTDLIRVGQNINEDGLKPLCYLGPNKKGKSVFVIGSGGTEDHAHLIQPISLTCIYNFLLYIHITKFENMISAQFTYNSLVKILISSCSVVNTSTELEFIASFIHFLFC